MYIADIVAKNRIHIKLVLFTLRILSSEEFLWEIPSGFGDYLFIYLTYHYKLRHMPLVNKIKSLIVMRSMKPSHKKKIRWKKLSITHTVSILVQLINSHFTCKSVLGAQAWPVPVGSNSPIPRQGWAPHPWWQCLREVCVGIGRTQPRAINEGKTCEKQPFEAQDGRGRRRCSMCLDSFLQSLEQPGWSTETVKGRSGEKMCHGLILTPNSPSPCTSQGGDVEDLGMTECSWGWEKKPGRGWSV